MRYEKPAIVAPASATEAVQGSTAKIDIEVDASLWVTIATYEADER